jgi:hypothetical protein
MCRDRHWRQARRGRSRGEEREEDRHRQRERHCRPEPATPVLDVDVPHVRTGPPDGMVHLGQKGLANWESHGLELRDGSVRAYVPDLPIGVRLHLGDLH